MKLTLPALGAALMLGANLVSAGTASAADALEATRQCMIRHGAVRKPDGTVYLGLPRAEAERVRNACRKQSGYRP